MTNANANGFIVLPNTVTISGAWLKACGKGDQNRTVKVLEVIPTMAREGSGFEVMYKVDFDGHEWMVALCRLAAETIAAPAPKAAPAKRVKTQAFDVTIRRLATGADYSVRLFSKDATTAAERATYLARRSFGIRTKETDYAHTRVVLCNVSDNQTRPSDSAPAPTKPADIVFKVGAANAADVASLAELDGHFTVTIYNRKTNAVYYTRQGIATFSLAYSHAVSQTAIIRREESQS